MSASSTILARLPLQAPTVVNTSAPAPAPASEAPDIAEVKENNGNAEQALVTEAAENIHNAVEKKWDRANSIKFENKNGVQCD